VNKSISIFAAIPMGATHLKLLYCTLSVLISV